MHNICGYRCVGGGILKDCYTIITLTVSMGKHLYTKPPLNECTAHFHIWNWYNV